MEWLNREGTGALSKITSLVTGAVALQLQAFEKLEWQWHHSTSAIMPLTFLLRWHCTLDIKKTYCILIFLGAWLNLKTRMKTLKFLFSLFDLIPVIFFPGGQIPSESFNTKGYVILKSHIINRRHY